MKDKRSKTQQVIDGAKYASKLLLGFAIFVCLGRGVLAFVHPEERSRTVGAILLVIGLGALTYWIDVWRKWFPGIFVLGWGPSLVAILTGHVRNGRSIDRFTAADYLLFFVLSAILSMPYATKKALTLIDKGALLLAAISFVFALTSESMIMLIALPVVLLVPLITQNFRHRRRRLTVES